MLDGIARAIARGARVREERLQLAQQEADDWVRCRLPDAIAECVAAGADALLVTDHEDDRVAAIARAGLLAEHGGPLSIKRGTRGTSVSWVQK